MMFFEKFPAFTTSSFLYSLFCHLMFNMLTPVVAILLMLLFECCNPYLLINKGFLRCCQSPFDIPQFVMGFLNSAATFFIIYSWKQDKLLF